jgi:glyoxylase-like metal-dependent hydrolase (beta-lactamase superfamily II)
VGFAALVEAGDRRILYDTGARPRTVLENARELKIDLSGVTDVVLTHNHADHTGGMVMLRRDDIDGYWVEPDSGVYDRIDPYWIDFELAFVPHVRKWKWRMWAGYGVEFFIHPAMRASPETGFPEFFRQDRDGRRRGVIQVAKAEGS